MGPGPPKTSKKLKKKYGFGPFGAGYPSWDLVTQRSHDSIWERQCRGHVYLDLHLALAHLSKSGVSTISSYRKTYRKGINLAIF